MISNAPIKENVVCKIVFTLGLLIINFVTPFFARIVETPTREIVVAIPNAMHRVLIIPSPRMPIEIKNNSTITAPVQGIIPTAIAKGIMLLVVTELSLILFSARFSFLRPIIVSRSYAIPYW